MEVGKFKVREQSGGIVKFVGEVLNKHIIQIKCQAQFSLINKTNILAHLSQRFKVSYCDHPVSIVCCP